jgi:hypothetical protein
MLFTAMTLHPMPLRERPGQIELDKADLETIRHWAHRYGMTAPQDEPGRRVLPAEALEFGGTGWEVTADETQAALKRWRNRRPQSAAGEDEDDPAPEVWDRFVAFLEEAAVTEGFPIW